ncbi:MAG: hypothetical protein JWM71_1304 [Solirubrobacteraceae bacterium]|nr:hypothetical protein [Solirubrobacteraceae bacterium]
MPRDVHRTWTLVMSTLMLFIGIAIVVRTIVAGGGALAVGLIMGVLFVLAGAGRLWVTLRGA